MFCIYSEGLKKKSWVGLPWQQGRGIYLFIALSLQFESFPKDSKN